jgi:hypothetical protein
MSFDPRDDELRQHFQSLKQQDEQRAPAFRRPSQTAGRWRPNYRFVALALILLAGIAFTIARRRSTPDETVIAQLSQWRSPTRSLLRTPGSQLLQTLPNFGGLIKQEMK